MHGLPHDVDLNFLVGKEVNQVAIGPHDVQLHFGTGSISIWSRFILTLPNTMKREWNGQTPDDAKEVVHLVTATITRISASQNGSLHVAFSNGCSMEIFDHDQFEAYCISEEGQPLIVV